MPEVELLEKTELWIVGVVLDDVRLPDVADAVATALSLPRGKVLVIDVRDDRVVLDVLQQRVDLDAVAGKQDQVLAALARVPGVQLTDRAAVHSYGVLGVVGASADEAERVLSGAREVEKGVRSYVARRVAVVSTGAEVIDGRVHDTNFEAASAAFVADGFEVTSGGRVADDERAIAGRVARLVSEGFGVVLTTGGVGAEDKDHTIEALQLLDPDLSTAVLAHYEAGHGRHVKDAVRIAVGEVQWTTVVALPGPTDEVRAALPVLLAGLRDGLTQADLAEAIAAVLRKPLRHH